MLWALTIKYTRIEPNLNAILNYVNIYPKVGLILHKKQGFDSMMNFRFHPNGVSRKKRHLCYILKQLSGLTETKNSIQTS